jgi:hypothetical protein
MKTKISSSICLLLLFEDRLVQVWAEFEEEFCIVDTELTPRQFAYFRAVLSGGERAWMKSSIRHSGILGQATPRQVLCLAEPVLPPSEFPEDF